MKKTLLASLISTTLISGCFDSESYHRSPPTDENGAPYFTGELSFNTDNGTGVKKFAIEATDPEGDILTFSVRNNPSWVTVDENGIMTIDAASATPGTYNIVIMVSDGENQVEQVMKIVITDYDAGLDNSKPVIEPIPALSIKAGQETEFEVKAVDTDGDDLTYRLDEHPNFATIGKGNGKLILRPEETDVGSFEFMVIVEDGKTEPATMAVTVNVEASGEVVNPPSNNIPSVDTIIPISAQAGKSTSFRVKAYDLDNNDVLTFSVPDAPTWLTMDPNTGYVTLMPIPGHESDVPYNFTVVVSDGKANVVVPLVILVTAADPVEPEVNSPPVVNAISPLTLAAGSIATVRITATDVDGDVITFESSDKPSWVNLNPRTGLLTLSPSSTIEQTTYTFEVTASDGVNKTSSTVEVSVVEVEVAPDLPNNAPELSAIAPQAVRQNEKGSYRVSVEDIDGDPLTYSLSADAPSWVTVDNIGLIEFSPNTSADTSTPYQFTVTVSDGELTDSQPMSIAVLSEADPDPKLYSIAIAASGTRLIGEVDCNGSAVDPATGVFTAYDTERTVTCLLGGTELGTWNLPAVEGRNVTTDLTFDLNSIHGANAAKVLAAIDKDKDSTTYTLEAMNGLDIASIFTQLNDDNAVQAFVALQDEKATDEVGEAPSSHVDNTIVAVEDPDASTDLDGDFVSSSAEQASSYKPSAESQVLTQATLRDEEGNLLAGISYYSTNAKGITGTDGIIEYLWGDTLTFGIDTYEIGSVKGNRLEYKLTDVTTSDTIKENIQHFVDRYTTLEGSVRTFEEAVHDAFAKYPNTVNSMINLTLPNGGELVNQEGEPTGFTTPNEFELQFESGLTSVLDAEIKQALGGVQSISARPRATYNVDSSGHVSKALNEILDGVTNWHVFHDNGSYYGATGYARGMRTLTLTNEGFPVLMPRSDANRRQDIGELEAWADAIHPHVLKHEGEYLNPIPEITEETVTYGLPFVAAGGIGAGHVMFMGNVNYSNVLSCPTNYWGGRDVRIDSANKTCTLHKDPADDVLDKRYDNGSMAAFFRNTFGWMNADYKAGQAITIGTNIDIAYLAHQEHYPSGLGRQYDFFVHDSFNIGNVNQLTSGGYSDLDPNTTPILLLQTYDVKIIPDGTAVQLVSDLEKPRLSVDDVTDLIKYVNAGGNIVLMDSLDKTNPEPIGRLADAVGLSVGGVNVTPTDQTYCGTSYYCHVSAGQVQPNVHIRHKQDLVVLEVLPDMDIGGISYTVNEDKTVSWNPDYYKQLTVASWDVEKVNEDGSVSEGKEYAYFPYSTEEEKQIAIDKIKTHFPTVELCTDDYEWEFGCIETRKGHGIDISSAYGRPYFSRYSVTAKSLVKAANIGQSIKNLYNHEVYYRTKGEAGKRLTSVDLEQTYGNLTAWMWNDNQYAYEPDAVVGDELGFEILTDFLNCYTNDQHGGNNVCSDELATDLRKHGMLNEQGELEPSYPLNYKEKPFTRMMLGRSFWDHDITVNTEVYPTRPSVVSSGTYSVSISTDGKAVNGTAGNMQSTGLWANQLEEVTISGDGAATITVMLADDLTGKSQHEVSMKRPPRMQTSITYPTKTSIVAPYGGLIYVQPLTQDTGDINLTFSGVSKAALYKYDPQAKVGGWVTSPEEAAAQIAEVDTGHYIYTTPLNNIKSMDLDAFSEEMNRFANAASDFHGRDSVEVGHLHERFTHENLVNYRHRFVNDRQIVIGAAHSGYPVMNAGFDVTQTQVPTNALNDWLLWHETGHNLADAPFNVAGSTEVNNNILALYMQDLDDDVNPLGSMVRVKLDIQKAPLWLAHNKGHAWANADAGIRLVMFAQLKVWAESHFNVEEWYTKNRPDEVLPTIYGTDQGWNLFKLMHRLARENDMNCVDSNSANALGVCASYASGYNLSSFFMTWNAGETASTTPDGEKLYTGGVTNDMVFTINGLSLPVPEVLPETMSSLAQR